MPKLVVTGDGSSKSTDVQDISDAVRQVATRLRTAGTDASVLRSLQTWADAGFKKPLRLTIHDKTMVVEYRN